MWTCACVCGAIQRSLTFDTAHCCLRLLPLLPDISLTRLIDKCQESATDRTPNHERHLIRSVDLESQILFKISFQVTNPQDTGARIFTISYGACFVGAVIFLDSLLSPSSHFVLSLQDGKDKDIALREYFPPFDDLLLTKHVAEPLSHNGEGLKIKVERFKPHAAAKPLTHFTLTPDEDGVIVPGSLLAEFEFVLRSKSSQAESSISEVTSSFQDAGARTGSGDVTDLAPQPSSLAGRRPASAKAVKLKAIKTLHDLETKNKYKCDFKCHLCHEFFTWGHRHGHYEGIHNVKCPPPGKLERYDHFFKRVTKNELKSQEHLHLSRNKLPPVQNKPEFRCHKCDEWLCASHRSQHYKKKHKTNVPAAHKDQWRGYTTHHLLDPKKLKVNHKGDCMQKFPEIDGDRFDGDSKFRIRPEVKKLKPLPVTKPPTYITILAQDLARAREASRRENAK
jgi:hypothetical protein